MALALAGCGGGGGGGGSSTTVTSNNVALTGTVKDTSTSEAPVVNVLVSIVGTSLSTHTDAKGNFSFASVPNTATAFTINNPNPINYFSFANYNGQYYDIIKCTFPLPTLHTGTNAIPAVDLYIGGTSPPPPPPTGCP